MLPLDQCGHWNLVDVSGAAFGAQSALCNDCGTILDNPEAGSKRRVRALFKYMAGWNADHHTGVTEHEVGAMRTAAREGLAILDGPQHPAP